MQTEINQAQPACRMRSLGRNCRVSRHTRDLKLLQNQIGFRTKPTHISRLQNCRTLIEIAKHTEELENGSFMENQLRRQLQKQGTALFTQCAGLVQKAR